MSGCRTSTVFGRWLRDLFDDCASVLGVFGQPRVLEGLGDLRWFPFVFPSGCILPIALRSPLLPDFAARFLQISFYGQSSMFHFSAETREKAKRHVKEFGRRSARPSFRPLLVDGEFPALGICGGGQRMQAAFLGAPSRDKCRVSTTSCFQKPRSAASNTVYGQPLPDTLVSIAIPLPSLPQDDDSRVMQVVLDATSEC